MAKPWYNFFVVTSGTGEKPPTSRSTATSEPPVAPQRVADIVRDAADVSFTAPVADTAAFDDIYRSAQIEPPPHGFTVLKVADMLQNEHLQGLAPEVKRKSILVALDAAGVPVTEVIEDAVRRDRALDTYERVLATHLDDLRAAKAQENTRIEEEIAQRVAELRARIDANNLEVAEEAGGVDAWRLRKQAEERRIADTVSHFVSENPITIAGGPGGDKGGA